MDLIVDEDRRSLERPSSQNGLPKPVADYHHAFFGAWALQKQPAPRRPDPEQGEEIGGHGPHEAVRHTVAGGDDRRLPPRVRDTLSELISYAADRLVWVNSRSPAARHADFEQPFRILHGNVGMTQGIEDGERRGGESEAEAQRDDRDHHEPRTLGERPDREPEIAQQAVEAHGPYDASPRPIPQAEPPP